MIPKDRPRSASRAGWVSRGMGDYRRTQPKMLSHLYIVTEAQIRFHSSPQSFARGAECCQGGAVFGLVMSGSVLAGKVAGSRHGCYDVTVTFDAAGTIVAGCDCPHRSEAWCKHIVAVLLRYLREPREVESESPLAAILSTLGRDALQILLLKFAANHPELMGELHIELSRLRFGLAPLSKDSDPQQYIISIPDVRMRIHNAVSTASEVCNERYYLDDDGSAVLDILDEAIDPLIEMAELCIDRGDGHQALCLLEAITGELVSGWSNVEDYVGDADDLFYCLGDKWAEALLSTDLSLGDRQEWITRIDGWRRVGHSGGADAGLSHASKAASEGWDNPQLVRNLGGDMLTVGRAVISPGERNERLTGIRLKVLQRQGRLEDAAKLARAEGVHDSYVDLLVTLGFAREAVEYGALVITTAQSSLTLAKTLQAHNELGLALNVAERGLGFANNVYALAVWTRDTAYSEGRRELTIRAGVLAVMDESSLEDYITLQSMSGDLWPGIREEILTYLCSLGRHIDSEQVDILLHEGLLLEALDGVYNSYNYTLVERVVRECLPVHPAEVIPICKAQAEAIISMAKSSRYHHAIKWLSVARDAYSGANSSAEWIAYKNELMRDHSRKSSLIPGLRSL